MGKTCEPLCVVLNVTGWVTPLMVRLPARV